MYQAAYHGVPVVALPFQEFQPENAAKMIARGMGVKISKEDITTSAFREAIHKVLTDPSYAAAAARVSRKLRARKRMPVQEAAGM
ncbi:g11061 [Coccomyxa viridis]|uniref:G11061 protein n=1 Tax=Coccomyxa viridis TaxID=1274662 RepID=A0ABP1G702_9CHLO